MTSVGLCFSSDVIAFVQNWHHLYPSSAGGKDLSDETQIGVIGSVEPEICMKMHRKLTDKLRAKLPATTPRYSMVNLPILMMLSQNFLNWKLVEGQSLQRKDKKRRKRKGEKEITKSEKP